jgi:hypothetical protein
MNTSIEKQLSEQGLRIAREGESGWYVIVWVGTETRKVWATDSR